MQDKEKRFNNKDKIKAQQFIFFFLFFLISEKKY